MYSLGMDLGTSTLKIVLMQNGTVEKYWLAVHHGRPLLCLRQGLSELAIDRDEPLAVCVTGDNAGALLERCPVLSELGEIPAIMEGVRRLVPQAGSIIEIGSQGARFITEVQSRTPQFAANEHCAGGTGSFFEDQMSRVGCKLEDYSALVEQAQSIPRLSGRCAVFAKTDIIHRQQEGVSTPDILLGLCYAMIRNYKATIVRRLPVCKPVVFCGGVTCNSGVIRAIRDVFDLTEEELIVPEEARFEAAIGTACRAEGTFTLAQLDALLNDAMAAHSTTTGLPKLELLPGTDLSEPKATGILPEKGCALGIDIGSTSTDLVLVGPEGELVDFQYLRTAGDPEGAVRKGLASIAPGKRFLLFSRSSCIGMHRYGGVWTGDNHSWWSHLLLNLKMLPSLNMCGFLYVGADLGGFNADTSRDLLLRWLALGVFTPLMRNHSGSDTRRQEFYQFEGPEDFRSVIETRYRLIPYLYSEYMKAALNGDMLFKPLAFVYPEDEIALQTEDQLMLGNEVMIAPVYTQNATGRMVYLPEKMLFVKFGPEGRITQEVLPAGTHFVKVALNEVPLFIRKGACIPVADPAQTVADIDPATIRMIGWPGASYDRYDDDGVTIPAEE